MADTGPPTHDACIYPRNHWCIWGAARTTQVTPKICQDGAAKAKEWIGRNKIAGEDLSEKKRSRPRSRHQGAAKGKLPRPRNHRD